MCAERMDGNCVICDKITKTRCSACQLVFYCSAEHQKIDWNQHKTVCHPFKIEFCEEYGRYLVATKDIKAGEVVLKESPILFGPSQVTPPVCVGCLNRIDQKNYTECSKCGWLVCRKECENNPQHQSECQLTQARGSKIEIRHFYNPHPTYQFITVMRALMLKHTSPKKFDTLMKLEPHAEERKKNGLLEADKQQFANVMPKFFKCEGKWEEDEILKVAGILQVNGHEVPLTDTPYVGVFNLASMVEHSCCPNLAKSFTKKGEIKFWAPNAIKNGERLSICYTDTMWGTIPRQAHLKETKFFQCSCSRCNSLDEFGTNLSAIRCSNKPCTGLIIPKSQSTANEETSESCPTCGNATSYKCIRDVLNRATKDLAVMDKNNEEMCNKYIDHYFKTLSNDHYLLSEVRISLAQLIGQAFNIQTIPDEKLAYKMKLCKNLIALINKIAPAESRLLGLLHFELHAALAETGRRGAKNKNNNFVAAYEESLLNVEKTLHYLQHEPSVLPEGKVFKQAKINSESLKVMFLQSM